MHEAALQERNPLSSAGTDSSFNYMSEKKRDFHSQNEIVQEDAEVKK